MFANDEKNGTGRLICENGDFYEGLFLANQCNGQGVYVKKSDDMVYEGEFKFNKFHGMGKETHKDGTFYHGNYKNGLKDGVGDFKFSDGTRITGAFRDGEVCGKAKFYRGN